MSDTPTPDPSTDNYEAMLGKIDTTIEPLLDDSKSGRIRDTQKEKIRLKQYRTLGYLIGTKRQVVGNETLDGLAAEVEELREQTGGDGPGRRLGRGLSGGDTAAPPATKSSVKTSD